MPESFEAPTPTQPNLPPEYLKRVHPSYAFCTLRCARCGNEQYDAGQGACLVCGAFWSLRLVWPKKRIV